ncbi:M56 family metallopeptidase [Romboutsia ilealis]|uniref:M56 family metallopeptidase n=1 Tax=Romboutsia faecis TaxID=2764597 RepID=A0ABR7JNP6_9FIRM|nr:M56 family metallopeptidase [Romboutsia faecis]MBC5996550.1 M56 family metallopeptidase [Romboutsia faecis]MRN24076.1 M56 family metallopeptidase [Romboutsia ilealis]
MRYIMMDVFKTSIYISIPIILIALLKNKILSKYTFKLNYMICVLITLRMIFISSIEVYLPFEVLNKRNNTLRSIAYISENNGNIDDFFNLIFYIWIIGTVCVITNSIYKQIMFYKKMKNIKYKVEDENIIKILEKEKKNLKVKRNIDIFKVNGLSSPALIGFINNKIIIPNKDYNQEELKWILRHELIHFKRKDNLLKLLLIIASAIHWFNPLVKILNKYFKEQCELSCDEKVVEKFSVEEAKNYALVLVSSLRYKNTLKGTFCSSQFNNYEINLIKSRVEGILDYSRYKKGTSISIFIVMIAVISIFSINTMTNQNTAYASESVVSTDFKSIEDEFVNNITTRLTEEEKKQVRIVRNEDNSPTILVGDSEAFSINKSFVKADK